MQKHTLRILKRGGQRWRARRPLLYYCSWCNAIVCKGSSEQWLPLKEQMLLDWVHTGVLINLALQCVNRIVFEYSNLCLRRAKQIGTSVRTGCIVHTDSDRHTHTGTRSVCVCRSLDKHHQHYLHAMEKIGPIFVLWYSGMRTTVPSSRLKPMLKPAVPATGVMTEWPRSIEPVKEFTAVRLLLA